MWFEATFISTKEETYGECNEPCLHAFHRTIWLSELEKTLEINYFQPSCQSQGYFSPFLWVDHNSPRIFARRKRCEDNCSLSTDTLFLPSLVHHACVHVYLNSKGLFSSPESNSHSWLLPRAVYLSLFTVQQTWKTLVLLQQNLLCWMLPSDSVCL